MEEIVSAFCFGFFCWFGGWFSLVSFQCLKKWWFSVCPGFLSGVLLIAAGSAGSALKILGG